MSLDAALGERIYFTEVGPRDGLQNLPEELPTALKVELIEGLLDSAVDLVEATSFVSPKWVPRLGDAELVMSQLKARRGDSCLDQLRVLVPNRRGMERALGSGARRVIVNLGVTESFNQHNLNRSRGETLREITEIARQGELANCRWDASLSVAFGCPYEGLVRPGQVAELAGTLADQGASEISLADTIGAAHPGQVAELVEEVSQRVPARLLSLHLHDTRGMGLANGLAGYQAGVRRFEGSFGGIGGCPFAPRSTGNVCSEDLLYLLERSGAGVAVRLEGLCAVAERLAQELGRELPGRLYRAGVWGPGSPG